MLLLQPDQVGEEVQAVNSAQRPEFEDDDFAPQVLESDWVIGAERRPDGAIEIGRFEASGRLSMQRRRRQPYEKQAQTDRQHKGTTATA
jgi:hypothetical protein